MARYSERCNSSTYILGVIKDHLIRLKAHLIGGELILGKSTIRIRQLHVVGEVMESRGGSTTVASLKQYNL